MLGAMPVRKDSKRQMLHIFCGWAEILFNSADFGEGFSLVIARQPLLSFAMKKIPLKVVVTIFCIHLRGK